MWFGQLTHIQTFAMVSLLQLKEINFYKNKISTIHHAFAGIHLTKVKISRNQLSEIPYLGHIENSLLYLQLGGNLFVGPHLTGTVESNILHKFQIVAIEKQCLHENS